MQYVIVQEYSKFDRQGRESNMHTLSKQAIWASKGYKKMDMGVEILLKSFQ